MLAFLQEQNLSISWSYVVSSGNTSTYTYATPDLVLLFVDSAAEDLVPDIRPRVQRGYFVWQPTAPCRPLH
jgi:hypothetical protein